MRSLTCCLVALGVLLTTVSAARAQSPFTNGSAEYAVQGLGVSGESGQVVQLLRVQTRLQPLDHLWPLQVEGMIGQGLIGAQHATTVSVGGRLRFGRHGQEYVGLAGGAWQDARVLPPGQWLADTSLANRQWYADQGWYGEASLQVPDRWLLIGQFRQGRDLRRSLQVLSMLGFGGGALRIAFQSSASRFPDLLEQNDGSLLSIDDLSTYYVASNVTQFHHLDVLLLWGTRARTQIQGGYVRETFGQGLGDILLDGPSLGGRFYVNPRLALSMDGTMLIPGGIMNINMDQPSTLPGITTFSSAYGGDIIPVWRGNLSLSYRW